MHHYPRRIAQASFGLILCGFGIHLTVQANIGLGPWDAFAMGLSHHLPFSYGTASMCVSLLVVLVDLALNEHIGIGTLLDAVLVGQSLNVFEHLNLIPKQTNPWAGAAMMILGLFIVSFFQFVYMKAGLCCGPKDALLVGLGKRFSRVPIGVVNLVQLCCVLAAALMLGGPVGFGTLISAVGTGLTMQMTFRALHFEPRNMVHTGFAEMLPHHHARV